MRWKRRNSAKGLAAGLIGGLAASWVMTEFQRDLSRLKKKKEQQEQANSGWQQEQQRQRQAQQESEEAATVKAAVAVSEQVFGYELAPEEKETAGEVVHYAYGTALGGLYGLATENAGWASAGLGALFGVALWGISDEIAVPLLRLAKGPQHYPAGVHMQALASHVVYGVTTEVVRRALRAGPLS